MADDRTVALSSISPLILWVEKRTTEKKEYRFCQDFTLGRARDNDVYFSDRSVSKRHVRFFLEGRQWWIQDCESRNGTFLDGQRILKEPLPFQGTITVGLSGPVLHFSIPAFDKVHQEVAMPGSPTAKAVSSSEGVSPSLLLEREKHSISPEAAGRPVRQGLSADRLPDHEGATPDGLQNASSLQQVAPPSPPPSSPEGSSQTQIYIDRYFRNQKDGDEGDHTRMVKRAYSQVRKQQAHWYWKLIAVFIGVGIVLGGMVIYQTFKLRQLEAQAADVFYTMKTVELELAQIEDLVLDHLSPDQVKAILSKRDTVQSTLSRLGKNYENYLEDIGIYSKDMPAEDRLILRMTRLFGESEVKMPKDFVAEVKKYILKWRSTDRLEKALKRAARHGYGVKIKEAMLSQHMPPEFFYLALQESEFDVKAVGPATRFGIAKGPWQFLPSTGVEYGLKTGPLVEQKSFDPMDERHDFNKATQAAAKFLRFLYTTRAQASGLLVIASYNWGPTRVNDFIEQLPPNPKSRNFWELLKKFNVPQQTKDYVFYIFSAAVIGENPALFGFSFDSPLADHSPDWYRRLEAHSIRKHAMVMMTCG